MFENCLKKQKAIVDLFKNCSNPEEKYEKIISLGKEQKAIDPIYKIQENRVQGCQSTMYLISRMEEGNIYFESESDALISAGLAVLLLKVYSGETPEVVLKCPPTYIEELGIRHLLTPGRNNGLASLYLKIKQESLRHIVGKT